MNLCDVRVIRSLLHRHGFRFSKSLGQNFLIDAAVPAQIAALSGAAEAGYVVEIGPGMGCLTAELCKRAVKVIAIELDQALLPVLEETLADYENRVILQGDALALNLNALCAEHFSSDKENRSVVACANLPYYITTPVITKLLESHLFRQITVMVQKEVAQRICALPGTPDFSAFSIYVQYHAAAAIVLEVPAASFLPRPKVDSAVLRLTPLEQPAVCVQDETMFFRLVRAAFHTRRKTLVNALLPVLGETCQKTEIAALLESIGLDAKIRGERLSLQDFARLADAVTTKEKEKP